MWGYWQPRACSGSLCPSLRVGLAPGGPTHPLRLSLRPMSETPDWSQVATTQDCKRLRRIMLIGFAVVLILPDGSLGLALATVLARFF